MAVKSRATDAARPPRTPTGVGLKLPSSSLDPLNLLQLPAATASTPPLLHLPSSPPLPRPPPPPPLPSTYPYCCLCSRPLWPSQATYRACSAISQLGGRSATFQAGWVGGGGAAATSVAGPFIAPADLATGSSSSCDLCLAGWAWLGCAVAAWLGWAVAAWRVAWVAALPLDPWRSPGSDGGGWDPGASRTNETVGGVGGRPRWDGEGGAGGLVA